MKAGNVVYDPDFESNSVGRPHRWGDRLGTLETLTGDDRVPWLEQAVEMYGQTVTLQVKWLEVQWTSAHADDRLTVVLIRDPTGTYDDAYFVRTTPDAEISSVIGPACRRWSLEVAFRNCKQQMRISSVQNGFAQGDEPNDPNEPGPSAPEGHEPTASRRTVPFGMMTYGLVIRWYLEHGRPEADLQRAQQRAPWYTQKAGVSFRDMLGAFRRRMEDEGLWQTPTEEGYRTTHAPYDDTSERKAA